MQSTSNNPQPSDSKQSRTVLIVTLTIAALTVAIVAAILINGNSSAPSAQNATTNSNTAETGATATIIFNDDGFSPSTLTVAKGTKVTVTNKSSVPVQFSSGEHPTHLEDPEINMDELAPGESGSFTVSVVGTHEFHDHHDDTKTGTLIVTE